MKIALIGYGRMGQEIEKIAIDRGHEIVLKIDITNPADLTIENLKKADVAIEFTMPASACDNYRKCFTAGVPVVSGTTGWLENWEQVTNDCIAQQATFFYASNFSLGVNLFFELNKKLAMLMKPFAEYKAEMTEVHHTKKLDAPSGTAISLANDIIAINEKVKGWALAIDAGADMLPIEAERRGDVPGIHTIKYESVVDYIEITHSAKSRTGFALGAVLAAEFSVGKKGVLNMRDLLQLQ